jgi:hypothetical protein
MLRGATMTVDELKGLAVGDSVRWTCNPPMGSEVKYVTDAFACVVWDDGESTDVPFDKAETRGLADCIKRSDPS